MAKLKNRLDSGLNNAELRLLGSVNKRAQLLTLEGEKMKAVQYHGPCEIKVVEIDVPEIDSDELLVKVEVTLTCGTDLKMYMRGHRLAKPPMTLGHEFAGVVVDVGKHVTTFEEGMRVVAANSAPCNACFFCRKGKPNLCEHLEEDLIGFSAPGAYAEYVRVPAKIVKQNVHKIPDHVSFKEAALLEPLACVVHGNDLADIRFGDSVVVVGAGPIGLLHLQLAKNRGAWKVMVVDISDERLQTACELGAENTINAEREDHVRKVMELTGGRGADVAIEAVGLPETWENTLRMTRKAGTVLLFGGCPSGTSVSFDTDRLHYGELTVKGAFHHTPSCVEKSLSLISSGSIKTTGIVTHEMPLEEVEKALQLMAQGEAVKVALIP